MIEVVLWLIFGSTVVIIILDVVRIHLQRQILKQHRYKNSGMADRDRGR